MKGEREKERLRRRRKQYRARRNHESEEEQQARLARRRYAAMTTEQRHNLMSPFLTSDIVGHANKHVLTIDTGVYSIYVLTYAAIESQLMHVLRLAPRCWYHLSSTM